MARDPEIPEFDLAGWRLRVWGQVAEPMEWSVQQILALPQSAREVEAVCEHGRRPPGTRWRGVAAREILSRVRLLPEATFAIVHSHGELDSGLSLATLVGPDVLFAHTCDQRPLALEHGGPLRLIRPGHGYEHWIKWVRGIEILNKPWVAIPR